MIPSHEKKISISKQKEGEKAGWMERRERKGGRGRGRQAGSGGQTKRQEGAGKLI